jgi:hypothetical protein
MTRRTLLRLLLAAAATCIALFAADLVVSRIRPARSNLPQGLFEPDASRGYRPTPRADMIVPAPIPYRVKINTRGYRDREWDFSAPFRVLMAGDSFTFGQGLPIDDGFVRKAERGLAGSAFYNAGVSGYGTEHVLNTIRQETPVVRPAHVFYMYFVNDTSWKMRADFATAYHGYIASQYTDDGRRKLTMAELERDWYQYEHPGWDVRRAFALWNLRLYLWEHSLHPNQLIGLSPKPAPTVINRYYSQGGEYYPPENSAIAAGYVSEMRAIARRAGAGFTMVILPSDAEGYYGLVEPGTERLLAALDGSGIDVIDLRKTAKPGVKLSLGWDGHYNAMATSWVAEAIVQHLLVLYPNRPWATVRGPG